MRERAPDGARANGIGQGSTRRPERAGRKDFAAGHFPGRASIEEVRRRLMPQAIEELSDGPTLTDTNPQRRRRYA